MPPCADAVDAKAATASTANVFLISLLRIGFLPYLRESQQKRHGEQADACPSQHGVIGSCTYPPNYNPRRGEREFSDQNRTHRGGSVAGVTSSRCVPSISRIKSGPKASDGV